MSAGNRSDPTWDQYCRGLSDEPELGLRLDVSRMRLGADDFDRWAEPMREALAGMRRLETGEIANPDEGRRVGHYWLRAPELAPVSAIAEAIRAAHAGVKAFAAGHAWRNLLWIGIGGSALGPQLLCDALAPVGSLPRTFFFDNTDPEGFSRVLHGLAHSPAELDRTLVAIVSKSGATPETRNGMHEVEAFLARRGLPLGPRAVAITAAGSALEAYAREKNFLATFPMWDWVGGRTSITSVVGLLAAALLHLDTDMFLEGARRMDEVTRREEIGRNPAALLALAWHRAGDGRGSRGMVVLPYRDRLVLLGRYLQQLVMESLGKEFDLQGRRVSQGLLVYGNKGSTDQHAYVQQLRDGPDDCFVTFVQVLRDGGIDAPVEVAPGITSGDHLLGFLLGTRAALSEKGRRSVTITLRELSERSLGALVALFERAVGLYANLIGINAYNQPGVEAGKRAAENVLDLQRRALGALPAAGADGWTAPELAARLGVAEDAETLFHVLEHLAANGRVVASRVGAACGTCYYLPQEDQRA